jgi:3-deoxy-D-manno-octulosonic-acid transferase
MSEANASLPHRLTHRGFFFVYRFFVWPLLKSAFSLLALFVPKIARGLELRESVDGRAPWIKSLPPAPPTIWFHCASGEFEYAKPVITLLKKRQPAVNVVVTFFSPTYSDTIRKFSGVDWVVPLPWDTARNLNEFLDSYRPLALLVARTDVWPAMAQQARLRGMKSALFSATLSNNSGRTRSLGRLATRATLDQLDAVFCATKDDADAFRGLNLNGPKIEVQGDTRYDQVLARLESPKPLRKEVFSAIHERSGSSKPRDLFVCGSTWPQDEDVLIPALSQLQSDVCGVLVPHEPSPEHLASLETKLQAAGLHPIRYSALDAAEKMQIPGSCLVVDQTGILAELYLEGQWAFVGGSFRKTVHSVMEPLAAGCLTFVGPLHTNNREAIAFQSYSLAANLTYVTPIETSSDLTEKLRTALTLADSKDNIRAAVLERTGSSQALVTWIERDL